MKKEALNEKQLAPIVLFCYNRPWHVEQTLDALSKNELADQSVLYIYCDGPKADATEEQKLKIAEVRQVIRKKQWCKEVHIVEAERNKGLGTSIIEGATEIMNIYGKAIVLEDDLVSSPYFLKYMNAALNFYGSYPAVFSVSANRPPLSKMYIPKEYEYDVFVSLRSYSTGWATWKEKWNLVDWSMDAFDESKKHSYQVKALNRAGEDMDDLLLLQEQRKIDSWAMRFGFAHFKHHAVAILPCNSYVTNIGFDGTGTHSGTVANMYENDLGLSVENPRFLDVIYEDERIVNSFYSCFYPKKRPLWKKIINHMVRIFGGQPPFQIKAKVYCR